ncbi:MAG: sigma-70 family RNA polymerase sigma factor [Fimbriimonadia bacterium]|jgi:RNA polymerase sigma-70 factor (ECF subfamily)
MSKASAAVRVPYSVEPVAALVACRPYVVRYLRSLGASVEDAEDLVQDTLLVALRSMPSFRGDARLSTWLCRIAQRAYAHWRSQAIPSISLSKGEDGPVVEGLEDVALRSMDLCECLRRLPVPLRLLVCSHYIHGYSYREICQGRGLTKSHLTNELSAARRLLRQHLVSLSR